MDIETIKRAVEAVAVNNDTLVEEGVLMHSDDVTTMELPKKLSMQFSLYTSAVGNAATLMSQKALVKWELSKVVAELFIGFKNSEEKMTEKLIQSRIDCNNDVKSLRSLLVQIESMEVLVTGTLEAYKQRHFTLKSLTDIYTSSVIGAETG